MEIPKKELGNTQLKVSQISFGASGLGGVFGDISQEDANKAVSYAYQLGINYFDTSPYYGVTKSEKALGIALQNIPRDQIIISTKVGRYGDDKFDFSKERIYESIQESLNRIKTTYFDIVYCHDIEFADLNQIVEESLPALNDLKNQGLIKNVGISALPLKAFKYVLDRVPQYVDCILTYCHNSLNDKSLINFIPYLQEKGVGIVNASPLSMGLLRTQGPPDWHPAPQSLKDAVKRASDYCQQNDLELQDLAVRYIASESKIATTLIGMTNQQMVQQNYDSFIKGLQYYQGNKQDKEVIDNVDLILQPVQNVTWIQGREQNN